MKDKNPMQNTSRVSDMDIIRDIIGELLEKTHENEQKRKEAEKKIKKLEFRTYQNRIIIITLTAFILLTLSIIVVYSANPTTMEQPNAVDRQAPFQILPFQPE